MMENRQAEDSVPATSRAVFVAVTRLTDEYCSSCLTPDYRVLVRRLVAKLARKRPSPLHRGNAATWACGAVYAIGVVNFLFDPHQKPYVRAQDLCAAFGVGASTGSAKSHEIMKMFRIIQLDPRWCLPKNLIGNPIAELSSVLAWLSDSDAPERDAAEEQRAAERAFWGRGTA